MPDQAVPLETLHLHLSQIVGDEMELRVGRLMVSLTQLIRQEYETTFKVNDSGGASSAVTYEVTRTVNFIEAVIGSSKANSYLQYLEYGVRGTEGGTGFYKREKAPPIKTIYEWIKRASLPVPKYFVEKAVAIEERVKKGSTVDTKKPWYSTDPLEQYAFAIAMHQKKFGTPALRVIERVLTQQMSRIEQALAAA